VRQKFDAYERDAETGLDFAQARYYGSVQGRFTSPDPLNPIFEYHGMAFVAWLAEPQRWNRYAFALNNPLRYVDQDGEDPIEVLEKAANRLSRLISRTGGNLVTIGADIAVQALREIFPDIAVNTRGLQEMSEKELAPLVAAFEGKSFAGVSNANEPGIDGVLHFGQSPATMFGNNGLEPVQLKSFSSNSVKNVVDNTFDIKTKLVDLNTKRGADSQLQGVSAFVRVTSSQITVSSLVDQLKLDARSSTGGLVGATRGNILPKATFFLRDGVVRVQEGKIFSCDQKGKCTQR
jgi:RHS repeat-associated protein